MMLCEVCGRPIRGRHFTVKIEGALMRVCSKCAKYGEPQASRETPAKGAFVSNKSASHGLTHKGVYRHKTAHKMRRTLPIEELEVVENFAEIMREQRLKRGMTQDEFGKYLLERSSLINKIESGKRVPPFDTIRKFEKKLGLKLLVPADRVDGLPSQADTFEKPRLGDIARIKKRR
ncbi:MAG: multiprotein bridging factor aMBF1 [Candidatus Ranarchaeia archaeon]